MKNFILLTSTIILGIISSAQAKQIDIVCRGARPTRYCHDQDRISIHFKLETTKSSGKYVIEDNTGGCYPVTMIYQGAGLLNYGSVFNTMDFSLTDVFRNAPSLPVDRVLPGEGRNKLLRLVPHQNRAILTRSNSDSVQMSCDLRELNDYLRELGN